MQLKMLRLSAFRGQGWLISRLSGMGASRTRDGGKKRPLRPFPLPEAASPQSAASGSQGPSVGPRSAARCHAAHLLHGVIAG